MQAQSMPSLPIQQSQYDLNPSSSTGHDLNNSGYSFNSATDPSLNQGFFDAAAFPIPDQLQQYGQPDLSYYGMAPSNYVQSEDIMMDSGVGYSYPAQTGAVWNSG